MEGRRSRADLPRHAAYQGRQGSAPRARRRRLEAARADRVSRGRLRRGRHRRDPRRARAPRPPSRTRRPSPSTVSRGRPGCASGRGTASSRCASAAARRWARTPTSPRARTSRSTRCELSSRRPSSAPSTTCGTSGRCASTARRSPSCACAGRAARCASCGTQQNREVWRLAEPLEAAADARTVSKALSDLEFVRATGFDDAPATAVVASLEQPELAVELVTRADGKEGTARFALGAAGEGGVRPARGNAAEAVYRLPGRGPRRLPAQRRRLARQAADALRGERGAALRARLPRRGRGRVAAALGAARGRGLEPPSPRR